MKDVTIRRMSMEEILDILHALTSYAFYPSPPLRDKEDRGAILQHRKGATYLGAFEDGRGVATAVNSPMTQQVRGNLYGAGAVWGVVTDPTARRQGYCRRLMARLLSLDRDEGRPFSCLYPFRASFYERLGYVKFPLASWVTFDPAPLVPLLDQELDGTVERLLIGDGYDDYRAYTKGLQRRTHGMAVFLSGEKERVQKENGSWLALARVEGNVVGVMRYALQGERVTRFILRAYRFYYDNSQARTLLLRWIARHVDQANEATLYLPPFEHPELWMDDIEVSTASLPRSAMGRVVDIAGLGEMRTGPGRFAARVSDPLCPWNEGLWEFETVDGHLRVGRANSAECELRIQALGALIYGTNDPGDFVHRGWGNPSSSVQATMRTMFPPRLPYLHELF